MSIKAGYKTIEFWVSVLALILTAIPQIPKEAFLALVTWVGGRATQKSFGMISEVTGKPSWQTTELWLSIGFAILVTVFPDIPKEALYSVMGYTGVRTMIKIKNK